MSGVKKNSVSAWYSVMQKMTNGNAVDNKVLTKMEERFCKLMEPEILEEFGLNNLEKGKKTRVIKSIGSLFSAGVVM